MTSMVFTVETSINGEWEVAPGDWNVGCNYPLYAILGDVENGRPTHYSDVERKMAQKDLYSDPVTPISASYGLPLGATDETTEAMRGLYSVRSLDLDRLLKIDWTGETITRRSWVNAADFDTFERFRRPPRDVIISTGGPHIKHIRNSEMRDMLSLFGPRHLLDSRNNFPTFMTPIEWTATWASEVDEFLVILIRMAHFTLTRFGNLRTVRAIYGFK